MTPYVTIDELKELNACPEALDIFRTIFGTRVRLTASAIKRARTVPLDLNWYLSACERPDVLAAWYPHANHLEAAHIATNPCTPVHIIRDIPFAWPEINHSPLLTNPAIPTETIHHLTRSSDPYTAHIAQRALRQRTRKRQPAKEPTT